MGTTCRQCRALLPGYIHRELSPRQRARVSRHMSACAECYAVYAAQRQLVQELAASVPRIGSGAPRLDKMRAAVMAEMAAPPRPKRRVNQARYSVVALALVVAVLLPWSMRAHSFSLPTLPQPEAVTPQGTAVVAIMPTEAATLTATLQSNYAPAPGATETP
ncbi:MAG: zf-HC2 domain-containing protein [Anaerolineae bacterium]|nr:zf-HC2 domain-containing protein [Anaerolineae bacterium]